MLVVDDNVDAAETLAELLELWGHDARAAHDGPEALRVAAEYRPEVVLLDIGLPGLDGYEVARRLRAEPGLERVVLIAVTGFGEGRHAARAREAGFDEYLTKPVDPERLRELLASVE